MTREERDLHQSLVAKAKYKAMRKMLPKKQRERDVKAERKAMQNMKFLEVEEQGFAHIFAGVAGAALVGATGAIRRLANNTSKTTDSMTSLFDTIKQKLIEFSEFCKKALGSIWIVPAAILAHAIFSQFFHIPLLVALSATFLISLFGKEVWGLISHFFAPQEQSGDDAAGVGGLICTVLCAAALPTKSVPIALGELQKRMSNFDRSKDGFESFFKYAMKYAEKAVNVLLRTFSMKEVQWVNESERLVDAFCKKVDDFETLTKTGGADISVDILLAVVDTQLEAIGLKTTVRDDKLRIKIERALARLSVLLLPYQGAITAARNFRPEPTFLCFYGGSGLGKTTMVTKLACAILVKAGLTPVDTALKNLWQKGNTEYWNGYANQKCLIMDDCFQVKPVKGEQDNEYMNVIRMIGNWAYALNFADLESKGKFYFDTPLVIGTTNCACVANQAEVLITQPEAVVRRIKHPYKLWVNEEYKTAEGRLDYAKVEAEFTANLDVLSGKQDATPSDFLQAYPWNAWYLTYHDFTAPQESGMRKEIIDLIEEVVEGIKNTNTSHAKGVANLERFLAGLGGPAVEQSGLAAINFGDILSDPEVVAGGTDSLCNLGNVRHHNVRYDDEADIDTDYDGRWFANQWRHISEDLGRWQTRLAIKFPLLVAATNAVTFAVAIKVVLAVAKAAFGLVSDLVGNLFGKSGKPRGRASEQSNIKESKGVPSKVFFKTKIATESGFTDKSHIHNLIYENTFKLFLGRGTQCEVVIGQVQFLELNLAVQPRHFSRQLYDGVAEGKVHVNDELTFVRAIYNTEFKMTVSQYLAMQRAVVEDHDVEFLAFPRGTLAATKKMTHFLLSDAQYQNAIKSAGAVRLDVMGEQVKKDQRFQMRQTLTAQSFTYMKDITTQRYKNADVLSYAMDTEAGMCGAPLTIAENRYYGGKCYLGMHVAGSPGVFQRRGFASVITAEMVADARMKLGTIQDGFMEDMESKGIELSCGPEEQAGLLGEKGLIKGSFTYIGKVNKPISLSPNTKLKLSPIGELELFGPNPQRPAHLKPYFNELGERVSPMFEGLAAYTTPLEYRELPNLDAIVALATKPFREATVNDYRGVFTCEEAVLGVEGLKIKSISRSTSAGYPYVLDVKGGKKEYFGTDAEFDFSGTKCVELFSRVKHIVKSAEEGVRLAHVFSDFLKDETRPHAKVNVGATRVISGAPLDYVIAFRMYFGAFMAAMFRHHTESGMCPGINPFSEWWRLASKLSTHGNKCFDGDFKRFDSSEQPYIHYAILDFVNRWYDDGELNARVRSVLWMDLVHSRHLGGDGRDQSHVYQWNKSLPSGHPFTTPVNSLYSLITLTACYCKATGDFKDMWDNVYIATFGDDNITNVDDATAEVFNQVTVARDMEELFGLTYTAGSKGAELVPYTTLDKCTFLKRRFEHDDIGSGGWVAPLDPASFLYISYYYKNSRDLGGEIKHNLESMLGELSLHSEEMWNEYFPLVREVLAEGNLTTDLDSRVAYRQMMQARLDAWY
jgi:hypothetical protein